MEITYIDGDTKFPDPSTADRSGLLAIGGSLTKERLVKAYSMGIFPWYSEGEPIMWWSPDPRVVLIPDKLHISGTMKALLKKEFFNVSVNRAFGRVIEKCSRPRSGDDEGTWITTEMKKAYVDLHKSGFVHSVEVWKDKELVGGLYGVCFEKMFFGESMFSEKSNSSKFGFIKLTEFLRKNGFLFMDCQLDSDHLRTLGASPVKRGKFLKMLDLGIIKHGITKMVFPAVL